MTKSNLQLKIIKTQHIFEITVYLNNEAKKTFVIVMDDNAEYLTSKEEIELHEQKAARECRHPAGIDGKCMRCGLELEMVINGIKCKTWQFLQKVDENHA